MRMARYDDHDHDNDRRGVRRSRSSGAQASDDRHLQERWRHAGYGSGWQPGPDTDRDYGIDRSPGHSSDYYDPDHEYRTRRHQRDGGREQPYGNRPMPGEHADHDRDRRVHRQQVGEEHAWSDPASWFGEGRFRGVGPKGYARSDDRIRELVCDDLMDDAWLDASAIEVAVKDGEVTLSGSVDSREAKRLAEDIAEHAGGARHVQNNLRIVGRETPP